MKSQNLNKKDVDSIDILEVFYQKKWLILSSVLIAIVGAYAATTFFISPKYSVATKVLIQKEQLSPKNVLPVFESDGIFIKNQAEIIASKPMIMKALRDLQLSGDYDYSRDIFFGDIGKIQEGISVDVLRDTSVIEMKVEHEDKDIIAPFTNAITAAFIESQSQNKKQIVAQALKAVENEVLIAQEQLDAAERVSEKYLIENGIGILPESEIVLSLRQFSQFDLEVTKANSELESVNTQLDELNKAIEKDNPEDLALPFLLTNSFLNDLGEKLRLAEIAVADMLVNYTMEHPKVIAMQMAINQLENNIADERKKIIKAEIASVEIQRQQLISKIQVLSAERQMQADDQEKVLTSGPKSARLLNAVKAKRDMVNNLLEEKGELQIYSNRIDKTSDMVVLESAQIPHEPVSPNLMVNLLLSALCGLTIGSAIAIMLPVSEKSDIVVSKKGYDQFTERRSSPRSKTSNKITYTVIGEKDKQHTCWSKDIGRSGVKIISEEALKKNSILKFKIHRDKSKSIEGNGVVAWSSPISDKIKDAGHVAGVKFYDLELDVNRSKA